MSNGQSGERKEKIIEDEIKSCKETLSVTNFIVNLIIETS